MEMVKKSTVYNFKGIQIHGKGHTQQSLKHKEQVVMTAGLQKKLLRWLTTP